MISLALDALAESRIEEAMRRGEFDDLPGAGTPLALDDDRFVPEALRPAYRILRNAGFSPPEVEARRERAELAGLIASLDDDAVRRRALAKLALLDARLEASAVRLRRDRSYDAKLVARLGRR
ncbi:MAG TPA: DnaJ family domain-containing protein [Casimicrobiaceae bacterium]|nr:DnaJ family domain-containing protein [Casimicrobiaceae bacterium]